MLQDYTTYRVLRLFFDSPTKGFQLREISRLAKLGMPSVQIHVRRLEKAQLVNKEKTGVYPSYKASRTEAFMMYKRIDMLLKLHESGCIEFLVQECSPDAVVLFGSASRGEDVESSDIDMLVIAQEKELPLKKYEAAMKRRINILFEPSVRKLPKELLNNVINGVVVYGYLRVF
ncbi:MAG: nucleotidyltransferase domain-containing protein [Candidatus Aenigmarchaeota archaeon]|nr:nucleotidyltransferase domain-containing protein [Candidatus Aenigmarchaeota archaeon]